MKTQVSLAVAIALASSVLAGCAASSEPTSSIDSAVVAKGASVAVKHIVSFRFRETVPQARIDEVDRRFLALKDAIPSIRELDVRYRQRAPLGATTAEPARSERYSHTYVLTFDTAADRDAYVSDTPAHEAFKAFVGPLLEEVLVVDYGTPHDQRLDPAFMSAFDRNVLAFQLRPDATEEQIAHAIAEAQEIDPSGFYLTVGRNDSREGLARGFEIAAVVTNDTFANLIDRGSVRLRSVLADITATSTELRLTPFVARPSLPSSYVQILSCDNGTARVYVDEDERRNLALVIAGDDRIMSYLAYPDCGGRPGPDRSCPTDRAERFFDEERATGAPTFARVIGRSEGGVFEPGQLGRFTSARAAGSETRVVREGSALSVELVEDGRAWHWRFRDCAIAR